MSESADPTLIPISKQAQLPQERADNKFVRGKQGWLFLGHDTNDVLGQMRGERLLSDEELGWWRSLLETRTDWLRTRGVAYHFLAAPNPHSVYPEMLPFDVIPGTLRPVSQLSEYLRKVESPARLLYPLDRLIEERDRPIYTKTNSHWTDLGAFFAYDVLMDAIGDPIQVRRRAESDLKFFEEVHPGDLGSKIDPAESSLHLYAIPKPRKAQLVHDNRVILNGHRMDWECPQAGESVCLLLGDSFAHALLPFLAESFGRLVFGHITTLDRQLVDEVKPDVVVSLMNERYLIKVPVDEGARSLTELAAEKRARGAVYPPRTKGGTQVDTPAP